MGLSRYDRLLTERPIVTNAVTAGLLGAAGDAICQFGVEGKSLKDFDQKRFLSMVTFSAFYSRIQFKVFEMYPRIIPARIKKHRMGEGIASSIMDNFGHSPFLYLPTFFLWTGAVEGSTVTESLATLREQFPTIMQSLLCVWVPVNIFTFTVIPVNFRVTFVAFANLIWNTLLDHVHHHGAPDLSKIFSFDSLSNNMPSEVPAKKSAVTIA